MGFDKQDRQFSATNGRGFMAPSFGPEPTATAEKTLPSPLAPG
jgi:hypothetical protein